jgi:hypothetical protein
VRRRRGNPGSNRHGAAGSTAFRAPDAARDPRERVRNRHRWPRWSRKKGIEDANPVACQRIKAPFRIPCRGGGWRGGGWDATAVTRPCSRPVAREQSASAGAAQFLGAPRPRMPSSPFVQSADIFLSAQRDRAGWRHRGHSRVRAAEAMALGLPRRSALATAAFSIPNSSLACSFRSCCLKKHDGCRSLGTRYSALGRGSGLRARLGSSRTRHRVAAEYDVATLYRPVRLVVLFREAIGSRS